MRNFNLLLVATSLLTSFLITGCQEGPAEKKGKSMDKAVENVKDKIQNKGPAQKAGEKVDDAIDN